MLASPLWLAEIGKGKEKKKREQMGILNEWHINRSR